MDNKRRFLLLICSLIFIILSVTQAIAQQQIVASSGGSIQSENISLSWTLGEPVIKTIEGNNYTLTQGFHQSNLIVTEIKNMPFLSYDINVYPNPVVTTLTIHIEKTDISNMSFTIINSSGAIIKSGTINDNNTRIPVQEFVSAIYFLKIFNENKSVKTFKIVKH